MPVPIPFPMPMHYPETASAVALHDGVQVGPTFHPCQRYNRFRYHPAQYSAANNVLHNTIYATNSTINVYPGVRCSTNGLPGGHSNVCMHVDTASIIINMSGVPNNVNTEDVHDGF